MSDKSESLAQRLTITTSFLDEVIRHFSNSGVQFVSMDELAKALRQPIGDNRPLLALTFDDGYRDALSNALPVLRKHGVPATIYVPSGAPDRTLSPWWLRIERAIVMHDEVRVDAPNLPTRLSTATKTEKFTAYAILTDYVHRDITSNQSLAAQLLPLSKVSNEALNTEYFADWTELRELLADPLITVGAHTATHPVLADLDERVALEEILCGRDRLIRELNTGAEHFAYPYGTAKACRAREASLVSKAGFSTAVTMRRGNIFSQHRDHLTCLPRFALGQQSERVQDVILDRSGVTALYPPTHIMNPVITVD